MNRLAGRFTLAALAATVAIPAYAADIMEPPVVEAPAAPIAYEAPPAEVGGWYIRGDLGYHSSDLNDDVEYINYGAPGDYGKLSGDLDNGAFSIGGGVGYQVNDNFRVDLTADHWFESDFRGSSSGSYDSGGGVFVPYTTKDESSVSTWLLLANAYVDLGTWHGFTPYVGAGIGGAHVKWDNLKNTPNDPVPPGVEHEGHSSWRFAAAAMVGASYCLTDRIKLDAGYRFSHIKGGKMFEFASAGGNGPGFDDGFNTHEVRGGLRYQFGGSSGCAEPAPVVAYDPPPVEPIYKQ